MVSNILASLNHFCALFRLLECLCRVLVLPDWNSFYSISALYPAADGTVLGLPITEQISGVYGLQQNFETASSLDKERDTVYVFHLPYWNAL